MLKQLTFVAAVEALSVSAQAQNQSCTRDSLKATAASYFKAVETHTMSALHTAANVRITENAAEIKPGEGFFRTGGKAQLQRTIIDTGKCSTLTQAVMDESGKTSPVLMAVRLKSEGGRVSEIETVIARTSDFAFKPQGVLDTKDQDWETLMPAAQRRTRQFLNGQADKYYQMFEDHKVDPGFATPCNRWENGTLTTAKGDCSWSASVMTHPSTPVPGYRRGTRGGRRHHQLPGRLAGRTYFQVRQRRQNRADSGGGRPWDQGHQLAVRQVVGYGRVFD
jgi:hypothetical protein